MEVRKVIREFKIRPKKRLGQNFLYSKYYLEKIVKSIDLKETDIVVEIGAGIGNLTELILNKVEKLIAVEKDKDLYRVLEQIFSNERGIQILPVDFLKVDLDKLFESNKRLVKIIGNPPYYISTQIIKKLIAEKNFYESAFLSFQKEYVERMLAQPNTQSYGRLTIFVQSYLKIKPLFRIPKNVFYPAPEIDSIFLLLKPERHIDVRDSKTLDILTKEFFQKRRKKIATIIKHSDLLKVKGIEVALNILNVDLEKRPEELSVSDYVKISNLLKTKC